MVRQFHQPSHTLPSQIKLAEACNFLYEALHKTLRSYQVSVGNPARFFKMKPGEYGAHDAFLGISNVYIRYCAKVFQALPLQQIDRVLASRFNEDRLAGFLILVSRYAGSPQDVYTFFWHHRSALNNWNLVDNVAPDLLGAHLDSASDQQSLLETWLSGDLWQRRSVMVASLFLIRQGSFELTFKLVECLAHDPEDIVQKAVGWDATRSWT